MRFYQRRMLCFALILLVCVISVIGVTHGRVVPSSASADNRPVVIIDAGHGGFDGGAVAGDGTVEKEINLNISLRLCGLLEFSGCRVIMTRTDDSATDDVESETIGVRKKSDLKNRLLLMSEYPDAIFVSVHLNKFTTSAANGAQVFYTPNFKKAELLGESIQSSIVSRLQPENTRVIKKGTDSTYLLHRATIPAVIVECGFLSNKRELERLKNTDYQSQMAFAIAAGVLDYLSKSGE